MTTATPDSSPARANRRNLWGYLAMSLGSFIAILDIQIVASSINQIQAGLSASADEIQWVQTAYLIAEVIAVPLSGYLTRMLSTRVYFVASALGFTLASLACAMSWNLESMVVFRAIQGFLGGGMIPTAFASMFHLFPDAKTRIMPQLVAGLTAMLAPSIGPTFGGVITDALSWHWLFLVNLVPGLTCAAAVWLLVDIDKPDWSLLRRLDLWGLLSMALFLGCTEYTLDEGPRHEWLSQDSVAVCAALALLAGGVFFWRAFTVANPIVELRAFRDRNFAVSSIISVVLGISVYTLVYITPLFLGQVRRFGPFEIGEVMMVQGLTMMFTAPIAGALARRIDPRIVICAGLGFVGLGSWTNSALTADWGFAQFALPQALRGMGLICSFLPMTQLALGTLPPDQINNGSGVFNLMRNLGGAIGLALTTTLISHYSWQNWQVLASNVRLSREPVREALTGMSGMLEPSLGAGHDAGAVALIAQKVQLQALVMTYSDMYATLGLSVFLSMLLLPLLRWRRTQAPVQASAH